jgi:hypothetical protein
LALIEIGVVVVAIVTNLTVDSGVDVGVIVVAIVTEIVAGNLRR